MNPDALSRLYGVFNGLLHMHNVDIYVTGNNSKILSRNVMTVFQERGDDLRVRPLSFFEFMQGFNCNCCQGWAEYTVYDDMPLALPMCTDERRTRYLERLLEERYLKNVVGRREIRKPSELDGLVNVLVSGIGTLAKASNTLLRTLDGFSEMTTAAGVAISAAKRNDMLGYVCRTFNRDHEQLLKRILSAIRSKEVADP